MQEKEREAWERCLNEQDVKTLCEYLFNIELTQRQEEIVRSVAFDNHKRVVIACATRYGKSFCVSMGVLIYLALHKNKRVLLVSPRYDQTLIMRNYISQFIPRMMEKELFKNFIKLEPGNPMERIKREVSRRRVTFRDDNELVTLSAEGTGERLMGFGGDLIILDEDCQIPYETYRAYIARMSMDNPDARTIEIGNPWHRLNQMHAHWINPDYHTIHIGYDTGIIEGRYSRADIETQRRELTPHEFQVLYEAKFPQEAEDSLFRYAWIENAINSEIKLEEPESIAGLDVAEAGIDRTVLVKAKRQDNQYIVNDIITWNKADTMATVGKVRGHIDKFTRINVDAIGVGKGVADRLTEEGYLVTQVKVGMRATREENRMLNQKSQYYWRLRNLFENGQIKIPEHANLISELMQMRYERTSSGKIKIIDPGKSPDHCDALILCCADAEDDYFILEGGEESGLF